MTSADRDRELQRLVDRRAIESVLYAYCRYIDRNEPKLVASLFTEDCLVDYGPGVGPPRRGRTLLEQRFLAGIAAYVATSHHLSNVEVTFDDDAEDTAWSEAYVYAWHRFPGHPATPDADLWGRYHDVLTRTPLGWRIAERTLRVAGQDGYDLDWHGIGRAGAGAP